MCFTTYTTDTTYYQNILSFNSKHFQLLALYFTTAKCCPQMAVNTFYSYKLFSTYLYYSFAPNPIIELHPLLCTHSNFSCEYCLWVNKIQEATKALQIPLDPIFCELGRSTPTHSCYFLFGFSQDNSVSNLSPFCLTLRRIQRAGNSTVFPFS